METPSVLKAPVCQRKHRSQYWSLKQPPEKLKLHKKLLKVKSTVKYIKLDEL